ncbi:hypothetical protein Tsubulata_000147 [Turnera subulata]|uniref:Non-specific lipid-transfer protein n=1 Tax=Turnera subulata TaxID=218843 RepID=A0A9Q0J8Q8_9ROSI|nr:hypothetical protein Tsubulata_000147 [Turnera subulata]
MASTTLSKATCMAVMVMVVISATAPEVRAAVSCNAMVSYLQPCLSYVLQGGMVPGSCCDGVTRLNNQASTTADRRGVCNCFKQMTRGVTISQGMINNAAAIPKACHVNFPYKMDPNVDCNTIN